MNTPKAKNVDEYIATFPVEIREILEEVRTIILETAPEAQELISYGMPGYKLNGQPLVYFAGYKKHIGLYATPTGHEAFKERLAVYKQGKGSVQFPIDQPMPAELIADIVRFRKESVEK